MGFVAAGASREAVLRFQASDETKARVEHLVRKEKGEGLLPVETSELDDYLQLEHLMRMVKARARSLNATDLRLGHREGIVQTMPLLPRTADDLLGTYRTFGRVGPAYEVIAKVDGEKVHIRVLESGEELDYPLRDALEDPEAQ